MATWDLALAGFGATLRPADADDAAFIVAERTRTRAAPYLGATSPDVDQQIRWLQAQRARPDDYYFVCRSAAGRRVGTIGLYNRRDAVAEWGRFVVCADSRAAVASLTLLLQFAFETLRLAEVDCATVAHNHRAIGLYEWAGFRPAPAGSEASVMLGGRAVPLRRHLARAEEWPAMWRTLAPVAEAKAAALAREGAQGAVATTPKSGPVQLRADANASGKQSTRPAAGRTP